MYICASSLDTGHFAAVAKSPTHQDKPDKADKLLRSLITGNNPSPYTPQVKLSAISFCLQCLKTRQNE